MYSAFEKKVAPM